MLAKHKKIVTYKALSILGISGAEKVAEFLEDLNVETVDYHEAGAAKEYFSNYHKGLNRRNDDPVNSRLNYGYAVVRSAVPRGIVSVGCHLALGIHHSSQLNAFNLADDLIEPFRPIVDLVARENIGVNERLSRAERQALANVLYNACIFCGVKVNVLSAIELLCESLKRILENNLSEKLALPTILPVERLEGITE